MYVFLFANPVHIEVSRAWRCENVVQEPDEADLLKLEWLKLISVMVLIPHI